MKKSGRQRQLMQQRKAEKRRQRKPVTHGPWHRPLYPATAHDVMTKGLIGGDVEQMLDFAVGLLYTGKFREAEELLATVQRKKPLEPRVRLYRAGSRMLQGDLSPEVWADYRIGLQGMPGISRKSPFPQTPRWDGSPMPGRTLLVWGENLGYGDWIQLSRLLPIAKEKSQATVLTWMPKGLGPLLAGLIDGCVEDPPDPETIDATLPLDLLPSVCPLTAETLNVVPYLHASAEALARWAPTFDRTVKHIGLHFRAESRHLTGKLRSVPLSAWEPLLAVKGANFHSLQFGGTEELKRYPQITDLGGIDAPQSRFTETAAAIACMDLLIAVDSSVAHLSGSLGVPCWLLLGFPHAPQWAFDRDETVFYPKHHLYHAAGPDPEDWEDLLEGLAQVLEEKILHGNLNQ